jgi:hypothetical protein
MTTTHRESLTTSQPPKTSETAWRLLYRIGGLVACIMIALVVVAIVVFLVDPSPTTVIGYFQLFQKNILMGLLALDLVYMVSQILMGLLLLAVCVALRRANPSLIAIALACGLVAVAVFLTSNPAFGMLSLSSRYAAATSAAQQAQLEAAGQAIMANFTGTAYVVSYILGSIAVLIISVVMLRSMVFSKGTAVVGLIMGIMGLVPASFGTVGLIFAFGSLVPTVIWLFLIAPRLLQLGYGGSEDEATLPAPA